MRPSKVILLACTFFIFLATNASGINFIHDKSWKEILLKAKKENKLIFLDAYASWCGPCKYLQSEVFTNEKVGDFYNRSFINVKMDMEEGEGVDLSDEFEIQSYPTLLFINGDGEIVHKKVGAMGASDFIALGTAANDPATQYYTIKKKAAKGEVSPQVFHQWITTAEEMEDEDADSIMIKFLTSSKSTVMEKEMLFIMLDHAPLNKDQIDFLFNRKKDCCKITGKTSEEFDEAFLDRLRAYAFNQAYINDDIDFTVYQNTMQSYFPSIAIFETKKLRILYHHEKEDYIKSVNELASCITTPSLNLSVKDLSFLMLNYSGDVYKQGRVSEFIQLVTKFEPVQKETVVTYHRNLALLALYLVKNDSENIKTYSNKILADTTTPDKVKSQIRKILED